MLRVAGATIYYGDSPEDAAAAAAAGVPFVAVPRFL
jgi:phosphoglycolate phosphatase-like HAD superfamily hydrolase